MIKKMKNDKNGKDEKERKMEKSKEQPKKIKLRYLIKRVSRWMWNSESRINMIGRRFEASQRNGVCGK